MTILEGLLRGEFSSGRTQTWTSEGVVLDVEGIQKTLRISRGNKPFDVAHYAAWMVRTFDSAEAAVRPVVLNVPAGRRTVGYIFPSSSFRTSSEFCAAALECEYRKLYASIAANFMVEAGVANDLIARDFVDLPDESELCDLLPADCSIVVVARRLMGELGATIEIARLSLQEHGYYPLPPKAAFGHQPFAVTIDGGRNIVLPAASVGPWVDHISNMVAVAAAQPTPVGAFIGYYQVFELLSSERFKSEVARIASDTGLAGDPWVLKEKLSEATNEKRRVRALIACCQAEVSSALNDLERYGKDVLRAIGQTELDKLSAGDTLYKVRSILVHDQKSLPQSALADLCEMVKAIHLVVFGLVRVFDPAFQPSTAPPEPV